MDNHGRTALVIGAGIAGHAAALALAAAGLEVTIVDGAPPRKPARAMSLWKNGRAALARLIDEEPAARLTTYALDLVEVRSFAGDLLWTFPAGAHPARPARRAPPAKAARLLHRRRRRAPRRVSPGSHFAPA